MSGLCTLTFKQNSQMLHEIPQQHPKQRDLPWSCEWLCPPTNFLVIQSTGRVYCMTHLCGVPCFPLEGHLNLKYVYTLLTYIHTHTTVPFNTTMSSTQRYLQRVVCRLNRVRVLHCFISRIMYIRLYQCIHVAVRQIGGAPEGWPVCAVGVNRAGLAVRIKPASVLENVVTGPVLQIQR